MRRCDEVWQLEQRIARGRLFDEHIECSAGDLARLESVIKRDFVDKPAPRAIDDADAVLHLGDCFGRDDVLGRIDQRRVQRDEIGTAQQIVELDLFDAHILGALRREEGVIGNHLHPQADGTVGDDRADIAGPDDAQDLAGDFDAHEAVLFPLAGARGGVRFGDLPRQRQHQRNGMLGRRDGIAEGRVHHDDALLRRRRNVDIVDPDTGTADHLELGRRRDDLLGDLAGRPNGKTIILADDFEQLVLVLAEIGLVVDVDAVVLEDLHGGLGKLVGNENLGHRALLNGIGREHTQAS